MKWKQYTTHAFLLLTLVFSPLTLAETVWVDVRSVFEHMADSIEGDIRISHGDILPELSEIYPDKSTEIRLYCRSGGRASVALKALKDAGYSNVSNAGSIEDARKERGLAE